MSWKWRMVRKGEEYFRPVVGGVIRTPAPSNGLVIEGVGFIPADELMAELTALAVEQNGHDVTSGPVLVAYPCCGWLMAHDPDCKRNVP